MQVGERVFTFTPDTFPPDSFLPVMLRGDWLEARQERPFLDFDPEIFAIVLNHFRALRLEGPEEGGRLDIFEHVQPGQRRPLYRMLKYLMLLPHVQQDLLWTSGVCMPHLVRRGIFSARGTIMLLRNGIFSVEVSVGNADYLEVLTPWDERLTFRPSVDEKGVRSSVVQMTLDTIHGRIEPRGGSIDAELFLKAYEARPAREWKLYLTCYQGGREPTTHPSIISVRSVA